MRWAMTRVLPLPAPASTSTRALRRRDRVALRRVQRREQTLGGHCGVRHGAKRYHNREGSWPSPLPSPRGERAERVTRYSTVTDLARFRGWSTSRPRRTAM